MLADMAALQSVLAHYPDVPTAVGANEALHALSSAPATKLFEIRYEQTPASVAEIAGQVETMRRQIRLAEAYVPFGLWGAAALSLAVAAFVYLRRPHGPRTDPHRAPPAIDPAPEREPMSAGSVR
jgi:hypothetical protein